jgi:hypothetical protein
VFSVRYGGIWLFSYSDFYGNPSFLGKKILHGVAHAGRPSEEHHAIGNTEIVDGNEYVFEEEHIA